LGRQGGSTTLSRIETGRTKTFKLGGSFHGFDSVPGFRRDGGQFAYVVWPGVALADLPTLESAGRLAFPMELRDWDVSRVGYSFDGWSVVALASRLVRNEP
jgi:hypothetical protein